MSEGPPLPSQHTDTPADGFDEGGLSSGMPPARGARAGCCGPRRGPQTAGGPPANLAGSLRASGHGALRERGRPHSPAFAPRGAPSTQRDSGAPSCGAGIHRPAPRWGARSRRGAEAAGGAPSRPQSPARAGGGRPAPRAPLENRDTGSAVSPARGCADAAAGPSRGERLRPLLLPRFSRRWFQRRQERRGAPPVGGMTTDGSSLLIELPIDGPPRG